MGHNQIPRREILPRSERLARLAWIGAAMVIEASVGAVRGAIDGVNDIRLALQDEEMDMYAIEDYANDSDNLAEPQ